MNKFDFNIHFPVISNSEGDVDKIISNDFELNLCDLNNCYDIHFKELKENIDSGNFMLFNPNVFDDDISGFIGKVQEDFNNSTFTWLLDFRRSDIFELIEKALLQGVSMFKFHSYQQLIKESDYELILSTAKYIQKLGKPICIDTSFGSPSMYKYDNLKFVLYLLEEINNVPVVLLHSGGARVLDAMLIAEAKANVYLETSYSLLYYLGSSVEKDLSFAYKKIGSKRIIYGSDYPYMPMRETFDKTMKFFYENNFNDNDIDNILYKNAINIG